MQLTVTNSGKHKNRRLLPEQTRARREHVVYGEILKKIPRIQPEGNILEDQSGGLAAHLMEEWGIREANKCKSWLIYVVCLCHIFYAKPLFGKTTFLKNSRR